MLVPGVKSHGIAILVTQSVPAGLFTDNFNHSTFRKDMIMIISKLKLLCVFASFIMVFLFQAICAQWKPMEGLSGGNFIDIKQGETGTIYAATTSGIYMTIDHGVNWTETDSTFPEGDVSALTVVGNRITVYTLHDGKFYSTDEGKHWAPVTVQGSDNQTFSVAEGKNGELIAQGYRISSRSTNGGETWTDGEGLPKTTTAVIAQNGEIICPNVNGYKGIMRSTDHGVSWSVPDTNIGIVRLISKKNESTLIVLSTKGVFVSTDDGINWFQTATTLPLIYYDFTCMVAGPSGDLFFGTTKGIYRTSDDGKSWLTLNTGLANTSIERLIVSHTGIIYAATYGGGVFTSSDNGATWVTPLSGLEITSVYSIAVNSVGEIFAGTFKSGIFKSYYVGTHLVRTISGLPINISATHLASDRSTEILAVTDSGLFRSSDNGEHWVVLNTNMSGDKKVQNLTISGTGSIVAVIGSGVYCSADHGASWVAANHGQDFPSIFSFATDGDSTMYASTMTGVLRSDNNGMKWVSTSTGLPHDAMVTSIAVTNRHTILAGTRGTGIYRSTNSGEHWLPVGIDLPENQFFNVIITDSNGNCFAGSNNGVLLYSTDDGVSWERIDTGIPNTTIYSLAISGGQIFAGTDGKGVWSRPISEITEIRNDRAPLKSFHDAEPTIIITQKSSSSLNVTFTLVQSNMVECSVYNLSGSKVASLASNRFTPGTHCITWNNNYNANGSFIVKTRIGRVTSKKVITILW
jgi:photosystem II stability/assembly factor-like uncharacterized protein